MCVVVVLTDALPPQLDGAYGHGHRTWLRVAAGTVTCAIGEIAVGDAVVVNITAPF